jgi:hypothetical protein
MLKPNHSLGTVWENFEVHGMIDAINHPGFILIGS